MPFANRNTQISTTAAMDRQAQRVKTNFIRVSVNLFDIADSFGGNKKASPVGEAVRAAD